mgnify:CR=1 FL=1
MPPDPGIPILGILPPLGKDPLVNTVQLVIAGDLKDALDPVVIIAPPAGDHIAEFTQGNGFRLVEFPEIFLLAGDQFVNVAEEQIPGGIPEVKRVHRPGEIVPISPGPVEIGVNGVQSQAQFVGKGLCRADLADVELVEMVVDHGISMESPRPDGLHGRADVGLDLLKVKAVDAVIGALTEARHGEEDAIPVFAGLHPGEVNGLSRVLCKREL